MISRASHLLLCLLGLSSVGAVGADDGRGPAPGAPSCDGIAEPTRPATAERDKAIEMLGLTLTDAMVVPAALYQRLERDISAIKAKNPALRQLAHRHDYDAGSLLIRAADDATANAIRDGTYQGWRCLARAYRQTTVHHMFGRHFDLRFDGAYDMRQLGQRYRQLPGIAATSLNLNMRDGSTISAQRDGEQFTYRFARKWGNCPSGCQQSRTWRYRTGPQGAIEVLATPPDDAPPAPDWVD